MSFMVVAPRCWRPRQRRYGAAVGTAGGPGTGGALVGLDGNNGLS